MSLASATLLASALGSLAQAQDPAERTLTIPVGNIGDVLVYRIDYNGTDPDGAWSDTLNEGFQVTGLAIQRDEQGVGRDVVQLQTLAGSDTAWSTERGVLESIDVATKGPVQVQIVDLTQQSADAFTYFGPSLTWGYDGVHAPYLVFQGLTVSAGQDLGSSLPALHPLPSWIEPRSEHRAVVAGWGQAGGNNAALIQTDTQEFRGYTHASTGERRVERTTRSLSEWFVASSPYPVERAGTQVQQSGVLIDGEPRWDEPWTLQWHEDLVHFEPGAGPPIPWAGPGSDRSAPAVETAGPGQHHPTDGSAYPGLYGLEDALRSVEEDPTLREFADWRRAHPQAVLAGASLTESPPRSSWLLVWADQGGDAYRIESRTLAAGLDVNTALGAVRLPAAARFSAADLPDDPITLTHAWNVWQREMDDVRPGVRPMWIGWGLYWANGPDAIRPASGEPGLFSEVHLSWRSTEDVTALAEPMELRVGIEAVTGNASYAVRDGWTWLSAPAPLKTTSAPAISRLPGDGQVLWPSPILVATATTAALALLLLLLEPIRSLLSRAGLMLGFSRLRPEALHEHPLRRELYEQIANEPGISSTELHGRVDAGWSTLVYHLNVMKRHKQVYVKADGRHRRLFATSATGLDAAKVTVLRNERTKAVLDAIQASPGLSQADIARKVAVTRQGISWHLQRLERAKLAGPLREGRRVVWFPRAKDA